MEAYGYFLTDSKSLTRLDHLFTKSMLIMPVLYCLCDSVKYDSPEARPNYFIVQITNKGAEVIVQGAEHFP